MAPAQVHFRRPVSSWIVFLADLLTQEILAGRNGDAA
jgi:hypothetical protein